MAMGIPFRGLFGLLGWFNYPPIPGLTVLGMDAVGIIIRIR